MSFDTPLGQGLLVVWLLALIYPGITRRKIDRRFRSGYRDNWEPNRRLLYGSYAVIAAPFLLLLIFAVFGSGGSGPNQKEPLPSVSSPKESVPGEQLAQNGASEPDGSFLEMEEPPPPEIFHQFSFETEFSVLGDYEYLNLGHAGELNVTKGDGDSINFDIQNASQRPPYGSCSAGAENVPVRYEDESVVIDYKVPEYESCAIRLMFDKFGAYADVVEDSNVGCMCGVGASILGQYRLLPAHRAK